MTDQGKVLGLFEKCCHHIASLRLVAELNEVHGLPFRILTSSFTTQAKLGVLNCQ